MRRASIVLAGVLWMLCLPAGSAHAQEEEPPCRQQEPAEVEVDSVAAEPSEAEAEQVAADQELPTAPDRWNTVLDLAFTSATGNEQITLFSSEATLTHLIDEDYEFELNGRARYGLSEGEKVAENYRIQINLELNPEAAWSPFFFTTTEHDPLRKLDVRANGGAGGRYKVIASERADLAVSGALLYSYEDYTGVSLNEAFNQFEQDARLRWRINGRSTVREGVRLDHSTHYQPIWNRGGDYLLEVATSARVLVSSSVALSISHSFERDSTPQPEVRKNDQIMQVGITFEL